MVNGRSAPEADRGVPHRRRESSFQRVAGGLKNRAARAAIRVRLDRVRLGNMGDCKPVVEGVSELRIDFGPGYCVYFGQEGARYRVALWGR